MTTEQTLLPCPLRVGRTVFGKGVSMDTVQECINRLWDAYNERTTVPAPIPGVQEAMDDLDYKEMYYKLRENFVAIKLSNKRRLKKIRELEAALIAAGAKE